MEAHNAVSATDGLTSYGEPIQFPWDFASFISKSYTNSNSSLSAYLNRHSPVACFCVAQLTAPTLSPQRQQTSPCSPKYSNYDDNMEDIQHSPNYYQQRRHTTENSQSLFSPPASFATSAVAARNDVCMANLWDAAVLNGSVIYSNDIYYSNNGFNLIEISKKRLEHVLSYIRCWSQFGLVLHMQRVKSESSGSSPGSTSGLLSQQVSVSKEKTCFPRFIKFRWRQIESDSIPLLLISR